MRQFFKYFAASTLAILVTTGLVIIIFVGIVWAFSSDSKTDIKVKDDSILELSLDFQLSETSYTDFNVNNLSLQSATGLD